MRRQRETPSGVTHAFVPPVEEFAILVGPPVPPRWGSPLVFGEVPTTSVVGYALTCLRHFMIQGTQELSEFPNATDP